MATPVPGTAAAEPSFERRMLAAFEAGTAAAQQRGRTRRDNPHTDNGPGAETLYQRWLDGFNSVRAPRGA